VRSLQEISKNLSENLKIENLFLVRNAESRYPPRNILTLPHDEVSVLPKEQELIPEY
jgi:hypothetical protein